MPTSSFYKILIDCTCSFVFQILELASEPPKLITGEVETFTLLEQQA